MQLIGWTPLVEMRRIAQAEGVTARIVGKLEFYQPFCSVKDRMALRYHLCLQPTSLDEDYGYILD